MKRLGDNSMVPTGDGLLTLDRPENMRRCDAALLAVHGTTGGDVAVGPWALATESMRGGDGVGMAMSAWLLTVDRIESKRSGGGSMAAVATGAVW